MCIYIHTLCIQGGPNGYVYAYTSMWCGKENRDKIPPLSCSISHILSYDAYKHHRVWVWVHLCVRVVRCLLRVQYYSNKVM